MLNRGGQLGAQSFKLSKRWVYGLGLVAWFYTPTTNTEPQKEVHKDCNSGGGTWQSFRSTGSWAFELKALMPKASGC